MFTALLVLAMVLAAGSAPVTASNDPAGRNGTDVSDPSPAADSPAAPASAADASPAPSYRTLQRGDKGEEVKKLQQQLIALGFLKDGADGTFGPKTAEAVQAFNKANGLHPDAVADAATQESLYGKSAVSSEEQWIPVDLPYTEWEDITDHNARYRVQVTNTSQTLTISMIELQFYPSDIWGTSLWEEPWRRITFSMTLGPGETAFTNWFYISPSWDSIDLLNWGVSKVLFDDGTIRENDDVQYWTVSLH